MALSAQQFIVTVLWVGDDGRTMRTLRGFPDCATLADIWVWVADRGKVIEVRVDLDTDPTIKD